jgi:hypothetical protein
MLEAVATSLVVDGLGLPAPGKDGTAEGVAPVGPPIELPGLAVGFLLLLIASTFQLAERTQRAAAPA